MSQKAYLHSLKKNYTIQVNINYFLSMMLAVEKNRHGSLCDDLEEIKCLSSALGDLFMYHYALSIITLPVPTYS